MPDAPATTPAADTPQIHPGDIVQVTDKDHPTFTAFVLVDSVRRWGVTGEVWLSAGSFVPLRLRYDQFAHVGTAALLPPDVLAARRDSIETARIVADEAAQSTMTEER